MGGRISKGTWRAILQVITLCATFSAIGISLYGIYQLFSTFNTNSDCADCNELTKTKLSPDIDLVTLAYGCVSGCPSCGSSSIPMYSQSCDASDIVPIGFKRKVEGNISQLLAPVLLLFFDFLFSIISAVVTIGLILIGIFVKNQSKQNHKIARACDVCVIAVGILLLLAAIVIGFAPTLQVYKFTFKFVYQPYNGESGCISSIEDIYWEHESNDETFFDQMLYTDGDMQYVSWNWTTTEDWPQTCGSALPATTCSGNGTLFTCVNLVPMKDPAKLDEDTEELQNYLISNITLSVIGIVLDIIAFVADLINHRLKEEVAFM